MAFNGQLKSNEIFSALYNMIISQEVFADNISKHQTLVDKARVDGGLYGDTKLYYATDALKSAPWGNDAEATNLLALHRPPAPECQEIVLDQFRQICLTVDQYLTKRAWMAEGAFSSFNGVMLGWMRETKRIYDGTLYNVFIGTTKSAKAAQNITVTAGADAQQIAETLANLIVAMGDYSRDFNDYGFLRSYTEGEIKVIWNSKYVNKIKKIDLPTIFHKEGLMDKFEEEILPSRYFGTVNGAKVQTSANDGTYRSVVEKDYGSTHVFPGDVIPAGVVIAKGEGYLVDEKVICKVLVKLPPYMSAFEVGTSFFNPKSLTENHYLTFGYNTLEYLKNYPFITVSEA